MRVPVHELYALQWGGAYTCVRACTCTVSMSMFRPTFPRELFAAQGTCDGCSSEDGQVFLPSTSQSCDGVSSASYQSVATLGFVTVQP